MLSLKCIVFSVFVTNLVAIPQQFENLLGSHSPSYKETLACSRLSDGLSEIVTALLPHFDSPAKNSSFQSAGSSSPEAAPFAPWTPRQLEALERTPFHRAGLARKMTLAQRRLARPTGRSGSRPKRDTTAGSFQCDLCVLLVDQMQNLWGATRMHALRSPLVLETSEVTAIDEVNEWWVQWHCA